MTPKEQTAIEVVEALYERLGGEDGRADERDALTTVLRLAAPFTREELEDLREDLWSAEEHHAEPDYDPLCCWEKRKEKRGALLAKLDAILNEEKTTE